MSASALLDAPPVDSSSVILAVNDSADFLNLLDAILCDDEVTMLTAESGSAALE